MQSNKNLIKSVGNTNTEILQSILDLYIEDGVFDLDPTYNKGNFYIEIQKPRFRFDISPQTNDSLSADCRKLPLPDKSIMSVVFDPPFLFSRAGRKGRNYHMSNKYGMFTDFKELGQMYKDSFKEFRRVLKRYGILVFKCQDFTDSRFTATHCHVHDWAVEAGFIPIDLFIMTWKGPRIHRSELNQRHARKFHSYFWVFRKMD